MLMIAARWIIDPIGSATRVGISLDTAIAMTTARVGFGAFPLGCAAAVLTCLISRHHLVGLSFLSILIGCLEAIRTYSVLTDNTLSANLPMYAVGGSIWLLSIVAFFIELGARRYRRATNASRTAAQA
jgi:hypothetical protein